MSDGNEVGLCILQSSSNTGISPSDCLALYTGYPLGRLTPLKISSRCILLPQPTRPDDIDGLYVSRKEGEKRTC